MVGIQTIIVIEDSVRYYSSFLPSIYTEMLKQSQALISEGINLTHKFLRMRARPKILLCSTFEEAWDYYQRYSDYMLGVISDIDFPRNGAQDPRAGLEFAHRVKERQHDFRFSFCPIGRRMKNWRTPPGAAFLVKDSPLLLNELRKFMIQYFSFGDFVFRTPAGVEVGRANDLKTLEEQLAMVPEESIRYHAQRNHFSNWLKARTEFWLAHQLRPGASRITRQSKSFARISSVAASLQEHPPERASSRILSKSRLTGKRASPALEEVRSEAKRVVWDS